MLDDFIGKLSIESRLDINKSRNIYLDNDRLDNLKKYLDYYLSNKPNYMLVGEAPGYKGCAISGIPFTSTHAISSVDFLKDLDMKIIGNIPQKESTATIIWDYFETINSIPLLWNIYPFHPHEYKNANSNRTPTHDEILIGKEYLLDLLNMFPGIKVVAIGKKAYDALCEENIPVVGYARHPSHGGKSDFLEQMNRYIQY